MLVEFPLNLQSSKIIIDPAPEYVSVFFSFQTRAWVN